MPANPIDLLFSSYRRQVLGLLLLRPDDSLHVREISRLTGVPAVGDALVRFHAQQAVEIALKAALSGSWHGH